MLDLSCSNFSGDLRYLKNINNLNMDGLTTVANHDIQFPNKIKGNTFFFRGVFSEL